MVLHTLLLTIYYFILHTQLNNKNTETTMNQSTVSYSNNGSNGSYEEISVPTFKPNQATSKLELNADTLSSSSIDALKVHDPFMYYSLFTPADVLSRSKIASAIESSVEQGAKSVKIERHSCVSTECDAVTFALQTYRRMGTENDGLGGTDVKTDD